VPAGDAAERVREVVDAIYRSDSRRVLATLIRLLGDFDRAEEAVHDAFTAALERWPRDGVPANPRAWLVSAGRFKAIDAIRRRARFDAKLAELAERLDVAPADAAAWEHDGVEDDRLRLIFTCCHPALSPDAQIALTLREVCGLTTEEIARAFLTGAPTLAQRIVRAKAKIRDARIPYQVPVARGPSGRLDAVLHVVYIGLHRGILRLLRRVADPGLADGRGDPPGAPAGGAASRSRRRWASSRSCCCTSRGARRAPPPRASWCCWPIRIAPSGTAG
jgi:RNA polymerase sigma-70 factor (ECF subfamily)